MVLVISHDNMDAPTDMILDWFRFFNFKDYMRVNSSDFSLDKQTTIDLNNKIIRVKQINLKLKEVKAIFYRRWSITNNKTPLFKQFLDLGYSMSDVKLIADFSQHFSNEYNNYYKSFFELQEIKEDKWIPNFNRVRYINKLEVLKIVQNNGIKIPKTLITSEKSQLKLFYKENNNNIITKPISEVSFIEYENIHIEMLTKKVTKENIEELPNSFFPTLFQNMVDKDFEIRIFFLEKKFYSMAMFSQSDKTTELDFRNYNVKKPNRYVPFVLPDVLQVKLIKVMAELGLNTGSIDMIYNKSGEYVFLEVNPVGQLGMVSENCNYNLEKIIAKSLIRKNKGNEKKDKK